jgi:hypothetical protein
MLEERRLDLYDAPVSFARALINVTGKPPRRGNGGMPESWNVEPEKTTVARQRLGKHVLMATNILAVKGK